MPVTPGDDSRRRYWRRMGVVVVAGAVYVGAVWAALAALLHRRPWDWGEFLLHGGGWALAMTAVSAVIFRTVRGRDSDQERGRAVVEAALASGDLPEGHAPAAWRRALAEESWKERQSRWAVGAMTTVITGLVAAAALVGRDWAVGTLAVALAGLGVAADRWCVRRVRRAEVLLARVDAG